MNLVANKHYSVTIERVQDMRAIDAFLRNNKYHYHLSYKSEKVDTFRFTFMSPLDLEHLQDMLISHLGTYKHVKNTGQPELNLKLV